ncbi:MAG: hypothetical protein R2881_03185 [Eubacteriales bacterium]
MNFVVKFVNRKWVISFPKASLRKPIWRRSVIVKNHRFFGLGAAAMMVLHVVLQILFKWVSVTGIVTAALAVVTVMLGGIMFKAKNARRQCSGHTAAPVVALILAFVHV